MTNLGDCPSGSRYSATSHSHCESRLMRRLSTWLAPAVFLYCNGGECPCSLRWNRRSRHDASFKWQQSRFAVNGGFNNVQKTAHLRIVLSLETRAQRHCLSRKRVGDTPIPNRHCRPRSRPTLRRPSRLTAVSRGQCTCVAGGHARLQTHHREACHCMMSRYKQTIGPSISTAARSKCGIGAAASNSSSYFSRPADPESPVRPTN
jgi:hypothetical protein